METQASIQEAIKAATHDPYRFFGDNPDESIRPWKIATHPDKWLGMEEGHFLVI